MFCPVWDMGMWLVHTGVLSFRVAASVCLMPEQVYKGRLRSNGAVVAVKVQRPGVRESIALDIHILRGILTQVS